MICPFCGSEIADVAEVCVKCGAKIPNSVRNPKISGYSFGIISLVLGILSILLGCCMPVFNIVIAIVGMIFGFVSMSNAKKAAGKNNIALAGVICSAVGLVVGIIVLAIYGLEIWYYLMQSM